MNKVPPPCATLYIFALSTLVGLYHCLPDLFSHICVFLLCQQFTDQFVCCYTAVLFDDLCDPVLTDTIDLLFKQFKRSDICLTLFQGILTDRECIKVYCSVISIPLPLPEDVSVSDIHRNSGCRHNDFRVFHPADNYRLSVRWPLISGRSRALEFTFTLRRKHISSPSNVIVIKSQNAVSTNLHSIFSVFGVSHQAPAKI